MRNLDDNIFTNNEHIQYPSLNDVADIRVINNNIKILEETIQNSKTFDFDNFIGLEGTTKTTTKSGNAISEIIMNINNNKKIAERITTINSSREIITNIILYDKDGISKISNRKITTTINGTSITDKIISI